MPKIINGLSDRIIEKAKRQMLERGYSAVTMRSLADSCGISVGTLYNYFPSKEALAAAFLLEDWKEFILFLQSAPKGAGAPAELERVFCGIRDFSLRYSGIFGDRNARKNASEQFSSRHIMLRGQIAGAIEGCCRAYARRNSPFLAEFVAEALIVWSVEGREFADIWDLLSNLFD